MGESILSMDRRIGKIWTSYSRIISQKLRNVGTMISSVYDNTGSLENSRIFGQVIAGKLVNGKFISRGTQCFNCWKICGFRYNFWNIRNIRERRETFLKIYKRSKHCLFEDRWKIYDSVHDLLIPEISWTLNDLPTDERIFGKICPVVGKFSKKFTERWRILWSDVSRVTWVYIRGSRIRVRAKLDRSLIVKTAKGTQWIERIRDWWILTMEAVFVWQLPQHPHVGMPVIKLFSARFYFYSSGGQERSEIASTRNFLL